MTNGWFKESYRHKLAANGVKTVPPTNKYYSTKGGYGGALLGAAHDFGSEKTSIVKAGELGKSTFDPIEQAGEASEPAAYSEGQEVVPDVKSGGEMAVDDAFSFGGNLFEKQYMAKKYGPGNQQYDFEERTGRMHQGESWSDYFKRDATVEVDENSTPDIVTLPESRKPLPMFARKGGSEVAYTGEDVSVEVANANGLQGKQREAFLAVASTVNNKDPDYMQEWADRVKGGPAKSWVYSDSERQRVLAKAGYMPTVEESLEWDYGPGNQDLVSPENRARMEQQVQGWKTKYMAKKSSSSFLDSLTPSKTPTKIATPSPMVRKKNKEYYQKLEKEGYTKNVYVRMDNGEFVAGDNGKGMGATKQKDFDFDVDRVKQPKAYMASKYKLSLGERVLLAPGLMGAWSAEKGVAWTDKKTKRQ